MKGGKVYEQDLKVTEDAGEQRYCTLCKIKRKYSVYLFELFECYRLPERISTEEQVAWDIISQATLKWRNYMKSCGIKLKNYMPSKKFLFATCVLVLLNTFIALVIPLFYMNIIDKVDIDNISFEEILIIIGAFAIQIGLGTSSRYMLNYIAQFTIKELRNELWNTTVHLPVEYFDQHTSGELMSQIINDTQVVKSFLSQDLCNAFSGILLLIGSVIVLTIIDWKITLLMGILIMIIIFIIVPLGNLEYKISKKIQKEIATMQSGMSRVLSDIRMVKFSTAENQETKRGISNISNIFKLGVQEGKFMALVEPFTIGLLMLVTIAVFGYGAIRIDNNTLSAGALAAIIYCLLQLLNPCVEITSFYTRYNKFLGACENLKSIFNNPKEKSVMSVGNDHCEEIGLVFENVTFGYMKNKIILQNISFQAKPNEKIAIVGLSGVGKTTILSLIERFYYPQLGCIYFNGRAINRIDLKSWRNKIAYVSQESPIMEGTIKDNLVYGIEDYKNQDLEKAIEQVGLKEFIYGLDRKYETEVGEKGVKLSGGQKQRIAIARAIIRKPEILLLDEATSHLDGISEERVQRALGNLMKGRVTIIVAHRLSTVQDADRLLVMENGKINNQGKHEELLRTNVLYKKLVEQQFVKIENV